MTNPFPPYSVCMSVYRNDKSEPFLIALRSMANQTVPPAEIVLVIDGPIGPELEKTILVFKREYTSLKIIRFIENKRLAAARQAGLTAAQNDWIAYMDSDDIAIPTRMEMQLQYLLQYPNIDVIGGQIEEFIDTPKHIVGKRIVPCQDKNIKQYTKSRCPMNMMTTMVRKEAVLQAGGFVDWHYNEDYYLWIRMVLEGYKFANLNKTLVYARVGTEMYQRRGGWEYFKSEKEIQHYMLQHKMISFPRYCYNVLGRFVVQVMMTNHIRGLVFQKLFRK